MTITEFLTARLDEDEAAARAVEDNSEPWPGQWKADGNHAVRTYNDWVLAYAKDGDFVPGLAAHIALHDPARVLREVEAARAILAEHEGWGARSPLSVTGGHAASPIAVGTLRLVLRHLASVYSDHPDYDPAWAIG